MTVTSISPLPPSPIVTEDQSRISRETTSLAVACPAIEAATDVSALDTATTTIDSGIASQNPSSQPSPSASQETLSVADLEDQIHTCVAGDHYDQAVDLIKEIQQTLSAAQKDQDYDVQLYIRVMTTVTRSQDPTPLFDVYSAFRTQMTAPLAENEFLTLLERFCEEYKLEEAEQLVRDMRHLELLVDRTGIRHFISSTETRVGQQLPFSLILQLYELAVEGGNFMVSDRSKFLKYGQLRCDVAWTLTTWRLTIVRQLHWIKQEFGDDDRQGLPVFVKLSVPKRLVLRSSPPIDGHRDVIPFLCDYLATDFNPPLRVWNTTIKESGFADLVIHMNDVFAWLKKTENGPSLLHIFPESRASDWEDATHFQPKCTNKV
jgi:hypothetical protein